MMNGAAHHLRQFFAASDKVRKTLMEYRLMSLIGALAIAFFTHAPGTSITRVIIKVVFALAIIEFIVYATTKKSAWISGTFVALALLFPWWVEPVVLGIRRVDAWLP